MLRFAATGFSAPAALKQIIGLPLGDLALHRYDVLDRYESEASRLARCIGALGDAELENPASWDPLLTAAEQSRAAAVIGPLKSKPFLAMAIASQATDWGGTNGKY